MVQMDAGLGAGFGDVLGGDFAGGFDEAASFVPGFGAQVGARAALPVEAHEGNNMLHVVAGQGNAAGGRLQCTNVMSGFVLRRFAELVAQGVRADKGFKDVHLNVVARDLSEFINHEVTGTQVYNYLRKWHSRWVKICRQK